MVDMVLLYVGNVTFKLNTRLILWSNVSLTYSRQTNPKHNKRESQCGATYARMYLCHRTFDP